MSRDVLILNGVVSFIERGPIDVTFLPSGDPPDASFISEADWLSMTKSNETAYIAAMGWTISSS